MPRAVDHEGWSYAHGLKLLDHENTDFYPCDPSQVHLPSLLSMRRTEQHRERPLDKLSGTVVKAAGIRLGSNLNSGGWGTVYLGRLTASSQPPGLLEPPSPESKIKRFVHRSLFRQSRLFAVKVLQTADSGRDKGMQDEEARLHFLASSNHHPGIVKLHQVVREAKFTYFILVCLDSGNRQSAFLTASTGLLSWG